MQGAGQMKAYAANALIEASPETVWAILTDVGTYPEWDTGVERVEGQIGPGETIEVFSKLSPGRVFPVTVRELVPGQRMVWSGGMPLGLFKGERTFTLKAEGGAATRFSMREEFTGPLLPLLWKSMPDLGPTFEQFAVDLKKHAEQAG
jgi:hypothetical protein